MAVYYFIFRKAGKGRYKRFITNNIVRYSAALFRACKAGNREIIVCSLSPVEAREIINHRGI